MSIATEIPEIRQIVPNAFFSPSPFSLSRYFGNDSVATKQISRTIRLKIETDPEDSIEKEIKIHIPTNSKGHTVLNTKAGQYLIDNQKLPEFDRLTIKVGIATAIQTLIAQQIIRPCLYLGK